MADSIDPTPVKAKRGRKPKSALIAANGIALDTTTPKTATLKDSVKDAAQTVKKTVRAKATTVKAKAVTAAENVDWKGHAEDIKQQASKTARSAADVAKDKTGSAMQGLSKLISDTAGTVDAKLGPQYGDYARYAAEAVAGAAKSLDAKDIDQLIGEARDFVRKSPGVAIGAAAIAGFVLMRLAKGSGSDNA
ncbi:hypothetical protein BH10PSE14_BH10PSE14_17700 [soil metagenome]